MIKTTLKIKTAIPFSYQMTQTLTNTVDWNNQINFTLKKTNSASKAWWFRIEVGAEIFSRRYGLICSSRLGDILSQSHNDNLKSVCRFCCCQGVC